MSVYYRAIVRTDVSRPADALPLCGGPLLFQDVERIERGRATRIVPISDVPAEQIENLIRPRPEIAGLDLSKPQMMGILNITKDSFSDGNLYLDPILAVARAREMVRAGAQIIDVGAESTRPGAQAVPTPEEIARVRPSIEALVAANLGVPLSSDTRKAAVAEVAVQAGASILNDVSALTYDADYAAVVARHEVPVCLMHAQGDPETMQASPHYDDVLLDVYDHLEERMKTAVAAGIDRARIIVDPGIGFGKTQEHNLALLRRISLFHTLGAPVLLGVSRKKFIGTIGEQPDATLRGPGSAAIGWQALSQGVQILRVHDIDAHRQMMALWKALYMREPAQDAG